METMAKSFFCLFFFFFNLGNKCSAYLIVLPICPHSAESYFVISHTGYILQQDQHICFFQSELLQFHHVSLDLFYVSLQLSFVQLGFGVTDVSQRCNGIMNRLKPWQVKQRRLPSFVGALTLWQKCVLDVSSIMHHLPSVHHWNLKENLRAQVMYCTF